MGLEGLPTMATDDHAEFEEFKASDITQRAKETATKERHTDSDHTPIQWVYSEQGLQRAGTGFTSKEIMLPKNWTRSDPVLQPTVTSQPTAETRPSAPTMSEGGASRQEEQERGPHDATTISEGHATVDDRAERDHRQTRLGGETSQSTRRRKRELSEGSDLETSLSKRRDTKKVEEEDSETEPEPDD